MNKAYIELRRKNLRIAAWYDVKLTGKISKETHLIAEQIKKDVLEDNTKNDSIRID